MRGRLRSLVNPPSRLGDIDLEETRQARRRLHEQVRLRTHLLRLLTEAAVDEEVVPVTPYDLVDTDAADGTSDQEAG